MSTLKAGSLVYRVIEIDPPCPGLHTWQIETRTVVHASAKQIKLNSYFSGLWNTTFKPDVLGRSFFETPLQAVQHFLAARRAEVTSLKRQHKDALRAIKWAKGQEGMKR